MQGYYHNTINLNGQDVRVRACIRNRVPASERIVNIKARLHQDKLPETKIGLGDRFMALVNGAKHKAALTVKQVRDRWESLTPEQKEQVMRLAVAGAEAGIIATIRDRRLRKVVTSLFFSGHSLYHLRRGEHAESIYCSILSLYYSRQSRQ